MIPLAEPNLTGNEAAYLQECITSGFVSSVGAFVDRFERLAAELAGSRFAVAVSSGTVALHAALIEAGVGPGDLVIIPDYTFIATANAVAHCGAKPWIIDVVEEDWCLDPTLVRAALEEETERDGEGVLRHRETGARVAALLPVHAMGLVARMDLYAPIAEEFGLPLIADGAASLGSFLGDRPVGALPCRATAVSFNGNKTFTSGAGGVILTDHEEVAQRLRHLTTTARLPGRYLHDMVGFNYRMSNLDAAVGCAQLERAEDFLAAKRRLAEAYADLAKALPAEPFPAPAGRIHSWWCSGLVLDDAAATAPVLDALNAAGIGARPFWEPMHDQPPYMDCPKRLTGVASAIAPRVLPLPSSTGLDAASLETVLSSCRAAFEGLSTGADRSAEV